VPTNPRGRTHSYCESAFSGEEQHPHGVGRTRRKRLYRPRRKNGEAKREGGPLQDIHLPSLAKDKAGKRLAGRPARYLSQKSPDIRLRTITGQVGLFGHNPLRYQCRSAKQGWEYEHSRPTLSGSGGSKSRS